MIDYAGDADLPALIEIEQLCFGDDAWSPTQVRAELDASSRTVFVVRTVDGVIGYASVMVAGDLADLQRIAVRPGLRRRGYGRALLDAVMRTAADGGAERILLDVDAANTPALGLYHKAGFSDIDRRRDYYAPGRDALVLGRRVRD